MDPLLSFFTCTTVYWGGTGQSHDGSFSDGRSVAGVNAQPSPNRAVVDNGGTDDLSVKDL